MKCSKSCVVLLCVAALVFCTSLALADEGSGTGKGYDPTGRSLAMHRYFRPYSFPMALTTTNIGVNLGYFYAMLTYPEKLDFLFFKAKQFQFAGLDETIDFEYRFHRMFSTEFMLTGRLYSGIDDKSAIVAGGTGTYSGTFIPKLNVLHKENWGTALTLIAPLEYDQGVQSSPIQLLIQVLNNAEKMLNKLTQGHNVSVSDLTKINIKDTLTTTTDISFQPSVLLTQTIVPALGFQGGAGYSMGLEEKMTAPKGMSTDTGKPPTSWIVGGMLSLDFQKFSSAAIGLRGELDYQKETNDEVKSTTLTMGGGIMYTGRRNLDLGVAFFSAQVDSKPDNAKGSNDIVFLNLRYYFE